MKKDKKISLPVAMFLSLFFVPIAAMAIDGLNANNAKVEVQAKQGGDWFTALSLRADNDGVLKIKNALPGWYKMVIDEDDEDDSQYLAAKIRMLDRDGRRLKEKTDVELSVEVEDTEIALGTIETDEDGWIELEGLFSDLPYKMDISEKDSSHVSKKDGVRIKIKAKIDKSDWFPAAYTRTDENRVLEIENVLPGKYKFKYKSGDANPTEPFTLKMRLRNEDGEKIKEPTDVDLFAYVNDTKVPVGTVKTDAEGWLTLPGMMTNMKYKVDVKD